MEADISILYQSDFFRIRDFRCKCTSQCTSGTEYSETFNISFIRKGNFIYNVFRDSFDAFNGYAIIDKPGCEYTVGHILDIPDECSIIDFRKDFFYNLIEEENLDFLPFFKNKDIKSSIIKTNPEIEYIHHLILTNCKNIKEADLLIDDLVIEILYKLIENLNPHFKNPVFKQKYKKNHLHTIEKAKCFISENYTENISIKDIASFVNVSPFHFSRLFKYFTNFSPYRYLLEVRLKNSELLIKNTSMPIFDVAIDSGFNNIENFSAVFKQKYQFSPVNYRNNSF
ncbi:MAG: helix-turn-helix transcriptional regulator [bacterium]|nr:helix-turn-helix transcriptional regulator [bacterium]